LGEPSLFRGRRCSTLFCATELERGRRSGDDQSGCLVGNPLASVVSPHLLLLGKSAGWRQALCSHVGTRAGRRRRFRDRQRLCSPRRRNGGSEYGVRGYISAYDADTGKMAWRFYTVPGDPAKPFEAPILEKAAKTWTGRWWNVGGGGTVWDSISYDPELDLVYFGVGNGTPW